MMIKSTADTSLTKLRENQPNARLYFAFSLKWGTDSRLGEFLCIMELIFWTLRYMRVFNNPLKKLYFRCNIRWIDSGRHFQSSTLHNQQFSDTAWCSLRKRQLWEIFNSLYEYLGLPIVIINYVSPYVIRFVILDNLIC